MISKNLGKLAFVTKGWRLSFEFYEPELGIILVANNLNN